MLADQWKLGFKGEGSWIGIERPAPDIYTGRQCQTEDLQKMFSYVLELVNWPMRMADENRNAMNVFGGLIPGMEYTQLLLIMKIFSRNRL